jgi:hypothetical protein
LIQIIYDSSSTKELDRCTRYSLRFNLFENLVQKKEVYIYVHKEVFSWGFRDNLRRGFCFIPPSSLGKNLSTVYSICKVSNRKNVYEKYDQSRKLEERVQNLASCILRFNRWIARPTSGVRPAVYAAFLPGYVAVFICFVTRFITAPVPAHTSAVPHTSVLGIFQTRRESPLLIRLHEFTLYIYPVAKCS